MSSSSSRTTCVPALAALVLALGGSACAPTEPDPPEPAVAIDCEVGLWSDDVPFALVDDDGETPAEMVFGFQGFLWVAVALRCPTPGPEAGALLWAVTTEDGRSFSASLPRVELETRDGAQVSEQIQIRLDNGEGASALTGLHADLSLRLEGDGYEGTATVSFVLVDDDKCIDTDEEPLCPDAGPASDAGADDDAGAPDAGSGDAGPDGGTS